jgi:hypothetical protein
MSNLDINLLIKQVWASLIDRKQNLDVAGSFQNKNINKQLKTQTIQNYFHFDVT